MQGAPEGQGHPCGWQVEGTEPADACGNLHMKAGSSPWLFLAAESLKALSRPCAPCSRLPCQG